MAKAKKVEAEDQDEAPVKKVSPKAVKKEPEKAVKKEASSETQITLKELCDEFGINPRDARIKLRKELDRGEGARWSWDEDDDEVDTVKGILQKMADTPKRAKKEEADEADEEDEAPKTKTKATKKAKAEPEDEEEEAPKAKSKSKKAKKVETEDEDD